MKKWLPIVMIIVVVAYTSFALGINHASTDKTAEASLQETATLEQDPELLQVARSIGAYNIDGVGLVYEDAETSTPSTHGDYSGEGIVTIVVKRGLDTQEERTALAHEYMHYIWDQRMSELQRTQLTSQLLQMYSTDGEEMNEYLSEYLDTNTLDVSELYATYCTEVADEFLTEYVLASCSTYMNRSALDMSRVPSDD